MGLPPEAPLAMVARAVRARRGERGERAPGMGREKATVEERLARWLTFGGALALTAYGTREMALAVSSGDVGVLQVLLTALFAITFGWIALSASGALAGALFYRRRSALAADAPLLGKTALVMPVYNEDPAAPMAALYAMARGLEELGVADRFEVFVASDTNQSQAWCRETSAVSELRAALGGVMPVWYRRRQKNTARKSGNVEDFVTRFGGRYDAMVMLDADSVMSPGALIELSRALQADPNLGLLQTVPRLAGARGFLPRLQQFASTTFGRAISRGVAAWQGPNGNYWGHNAIMRMEAFAEACGLPELRGRRPFGGPILSHDFAEAAWMGRAGWSVRMDPEIGGSFEDGPPTLLDLSQRDRRWMQGNLQHSGILGAAGLSLPSRAHLASGIAGYLMSPLWLALMLVGAVVAAQAARVEPSYFTEPFQLTPSWPRFDSERMLALFWLSMGVLLIPKALGLLHASAATLRTRGLKATVALIISALIELGFSALYAPIAMALQTRQFFEIMLGRDSGWNVQSREGASTPWLTCVRRHAGHTLAGALTLGLTLRWLPDLAIWIAPTCAGLLLSVPLSRLSGSVAVGDWLRRRGLAASPEELSTPAILAARDAAIPRFERAIGNVHGLRSIAQRAALRDRHFEMAGELDRGQRGQPDLVQLGALAKVQDARTLDELVKWLTNAETLSLLHSRDQLEIVAALASRPSASHEAPAAAGAVAVHKKLRERYRRSLRGQ